MLRTKKFFRALFLGLILCICFAFGGCAKAEGVYKFSKMSYSEGGVQVELEVGEKYMGMITLSEDFMTITLNDDGTATMSNNFGEESETVNGTWKKLDNKTIEINFGGEAVECACDGKTLTIDADGATMVLAK